MRLCSIIKAALFAGVLAVTGCSENVGTVYSMRSNAAVYEIAKPDAASVKKVLALRGKSPEEVKKEVRTPLEAKIFLSRVIEYDSDENVYGKDDYHATFEGAERAKNNPVRFFF